MSLIGASGGVVFYSLNSFQHWALWLDKLGLAFHFVLFASFLAVSVLKIFAADAASSCSTILLLSTLVFLHCHVFSEKLSFFQNLISPTFKMRSDITGWKPGRDYVVTLFPQRVSVPDSAVALTILQPELKFRSDRLSFMFEGSFMQPGLIQRGLSILKGDFSSSSSSLMQVGHGCQSAAIEKKERTKCVTLTWLFVYSCLSTCRPPVLSQVLPRAHGASQGSVVAVHRMQDLQQLSRSRKERGEWMC